MAAKVKFERGAWWVFTHYDGKRTKKRVGSAKKDNARAEKIAEKINAALALGTFRPRGAEKPLPTDEALRSWLTAYEATLKPSTRELAEGILKRHLIPFFGSKDLRELREADLMAYVSAKVEAGRHPRTVRNDLSILRRVLTLLVREGQLQRNPASGMGEMLRRVHQASAVETEEVETWSRDEVATLLETARETDPRFAPLLALLFATGMRRGEALGLQWADVNLEARTLTVRRAVTKEGVTTPKSGRARKVPMTHALAEQLFDVLATRKSEALARWKGEVPAWVFCSEVGGALEPRNVERSWYRLLRHCQKRGRFVRALKLHCTRHTWATLALRAGKSVRWVADVLGHADPALTLRVYAHALGDEEHDLGFLDFGAPGRPQTAPRAENIRETEGRSDEIPNNLAEVAWRAGRGSNPRPPGSKPGALSS